MQPATEPRPSPVPLNLPVTQAICVSAHAGRVFTSMKGGDPAAPSDTATLLRLNPPYQAHLRQLPPLRVRPSTSGAPNSGHLTGGVYKARERIHRSVADLRLLAIPASWGRVTDPNPN